jgi:gas vesicle structural protein
VTHPADFDPEDLPEHLVLSDLLTRVLDKGVVVHSHITISMADVDLIQLDLRLLLSSVATLQRRAKGVPGADAPVRTDAGR